MEKLVVRKLRPSDEKAFREATAAWLASGSFSWTHPKEGESFASFLAMLDQHERGENLPTGYVPATVLGGFLDDKLVGRVNFRHELNDFLLKVGGHIGYGVLPNFRRRGIATELLRATLKEAKSRGLKRVLVTCNDDNVGSAKTIEKNGGQLENVLTLGDDQKAKRRYWIEL